jgi:protein-S-isoprenylcysteine O-methyltransferase Ste14
MKFSYLVIFISILWYGSEIILAIVKRPKPDSITRLSKSSSRRLLLITSISVAIGVFIGLRGIGSVRGWYPWVSYVGLALLVLGLIIRWIAILTLKQYFTVDIAIIKDHIIINHGLYKYIRHPSYAGGMLSFLGLGLTFSNWLTPLIIFIPTFLAFSNRIKIEEKALLGAFGDDYKVYMSKTKKMIPGIY